MCAVVGCWGSVAPEGWRGWEVAEAEGHFGSVSGGLLQVRLDL